MSLWEYKVITSGKGGFARPDLLEKFLNDLGRDEWEIVEFHTAPENFLVFTGLARRPTQRDWTLEDAASAAAKIEADKLRAEFEAKFKAATAPAPPEERASEFLQEKVAPDDGFRKPVDTSHDADPDSEEEDEKDEWEQLTAAEDEELPTFFDAIKPHMRRNQRGPGMSVGVDYLAKKWDQSEDDLIAALGECGFVVPEDEDAKTEYVEYDGDLYWLNVNRRGELWINTKEKPRPVFRPVKAQKAVVEEERKSEAKPRKSEGRSEKPEAEATTSEAGDVKSDGAELEAGGADAEETSTAGKSGARSAKPDAPAAELPQGLALLKKIRPHMRRNRRGPGGSGSTSFLARALKCGEDDLKAAFSALGLKIPTSANEKPEYLEIGNDLWWLNADSRGGLWINGREKRPGETVGAAAEQTAEQTAEQRTDEPGKHPGEEGAESAEAADSEEALESEPAAAAAKAVEPSEAEVKDGERKQVQPEEAGEQAAAPQELEQKEAEQKELPLREVEPHPAALPQAAIAVEPTPADGPTDAPRSADSAGEPPLGEPALFEPQPSYSRETGTPTESAAPMESVSADTPPAPEPEMAPDAAARPVDSAGVLATVRPLLKENRTGAVAARVDGVAEEIGKPSDELLSTLIEAGLKVPEKPREKPAFVEQAGEVLWLSRNTKGELWLNAKASKLEGAEETEEELGTEVPAGESGSATESDGEKKAKRVRTRKKPESEEP
jgi:hypothetical protein